MSVVQFWGEKQKTSPTKRNATGLLFKAACGLGILSFGANAQEWSLRLEGDNQTRFEFLENQFRPGFAGNSSALLIRTNVRAFVESENITFGFELSDARAELVDNDNELNTGLVNTLEPLQFFVRAKTQDVFGAGDEASVQLGRFTFDFGARRLLGRFKFRNSISSHQGLRLDWRSKDGDELTVLGIMPGRIAPNSPADLAGNDVALDDFSFDQTLVGLYGVNRSWLPGVRFDGYLLQLNERDDADDNFQTANRDLLTIGARAFKAPAAGQFDFDIEGAYQTGERRASANPLDTQDLDVSAGFMHVDVGYRFDAPWQPRIAALYDFASGDRDPFDDSTQRFDTLFGPQRGDFGPTSLNLLLTRDNLSAVGARLQVSPAKGWTLMAHWKATWLATLRDQFTRTGVQDVTGASSRFAGHFLEVRSRTWLKKDVVRFEAGLATFFNGAFFEEAPNATGNGNPFYGYVQLEVNF